MNKTRSVFRSIFRVLALVILALATLQVLHARADDTAPALSPQAAPQTQVGVAEDLEKKRLALDEKEKSLAEKEEEIKSQSAELEKRMQRIEQLRQEVSGEAQKKQEQNAERIAKMVDVFQTMTPKAASQVMEALDDALAVAVLNSMDPKRVAKIMNVMDKERSAKLSEELTGYYNPTNSGRQVASQEPAGQAQAGAVQSKGKEVKK